MNDVAFEVVGKLDLSQILNQIRTLREQAALGNIEPNVAATQIAQAAVPLRVASNQLLNLGAPPDRPILGAYATGIKEAQNAFIALGGTIREFDKVMAQATALNRQMAREGAPGAIPPNLRINAPVPVVAAGGEGAPPPPPPSVFIPSPEENQNLPPFLRGKARLSNQLGTGKGIGSGDEAEPTSELQDAVEKQRKVNAELDLQVRTERSILAGDNELLELKTKEILDNRELTGLNARRQAAALAAAGVAGETEALAGQAELQRVTETQRLEVLRLILNNDQELLVSKAESLVRNREIAAAEAEIETEALQLAGVAGLAGQMASLRRRALEAQQQETEAILQQVALDGELVAIAEQEILQARKRRAADAELNNAGLNRAGTSGELEAQRSELQDQATVNSQRLAVLRATLAPEEGILAIKTADLVLSRSIQAAQLRVQNAVLQGAGTRQATSVEQASIEKQITIENQRIALLEAIANNEKGLLDLKAEQAVQARQARAAQAVVDAKVLEEAGIAGETVALAAETQKQLVVQAQRLAILQATLSDEEGLLALKAEEIVEQRLINAAEKEVEAAALARAGTGGLVEGVQAESSLLQQRLVTAEAILANDKGILDSKAQQLLLSKEVTVKEAEAAALVTKTAGLQSGSPSFLQRAQAGLGGLGGGVARDATEYSTGGQLLGRALITTGRFAASGALFYGAFQGIRQVVSASEDLEKQFNIIQQQFKSLGKGDQFAGFRDGILQIARDTGSTAQDVAQVGFQLQGAFGGDTQKALEATAQAFEAVKVTGLNITEVIDAFTSLTQNFKSSNVTIAEVSDTALGLQERFGVLAKETISFASDLAPVAAQVGFTVKQLEALGAVAQKYSGKSGSSLAEAFGRVLPQVQSNALQFTQLFTQVGGKSLGDSVAQSLAGGQTAQFFNTLLEQYPKLTKAQQDYVITLLGGRREAQAVIPVLEHASETLAEFNRTTTDTGKTQQYFNDLQSTLAQRLSELGQSLTQLGVTLFNSGVGQFFSSLVGVLNQVVSLFSKVIGGVSSFRSEFANLPGLGAGGGPGDAAGTLSSSVLQGLLLYGAFKGGAGFLKGAASASAEGSGILGQIAAGAGGAGSAVSGGALLAKIRGTSAPVVEASTAVSEASVAGETVLPGGLTVAAAGTEAVGAAGAAEAATAFAGEFGAGVAAGPWVGLGTLIANQILSGFNAHAQQNAEKSVQSILGPSGALDTSDKVSGIYKQLGYNVPSTPGLISATTLPPEIQKDFQAFLDSNGGKGQLSGANLSGKLTLDNYRDFLKTQGTRNETAGETAANLIPGYDTQDRRRAGIDADAEKNRLQAAIEAEANQATQPDVLNEIVRQKDHLAPGSAVDPQRVQQVQNDIQAIVDRIKNHGGNIYELDQYLGTSLGDAIKAINALQAKNEQNTQAGVDILSSREVLDKFQSGDIGIAQASRALQVIVGQEKQLGFDTSADPKNRKQLADDIKQASTLQSQGLLHQAQALVAARDLAGGSDQNRALEQVKTYTDLLKNGGLNPADSKTASDQVIAGLKAVQEARISSTHDVALQAQYLAEGISVPKPVQQELVYEYLNQYDIEFQNFIIDSLQGTGILAEALTKAVSDIYSVGGVTLQQATRQFLQGHIADLQAKKALLEKNIQINGDNIARVLAEQKLLDQTNRAIDDTQKALDTTPDFQAPPDYSTVGKGDPQAVADKNNEVAQKAIDIRKAQLDVQKAIIEGDPVAEAAIQQQLAELDRQAAELQQDPQDRQKALLEAQAEAISANHASLKAIVDQAAAQRDLVLAQGGDNPVQAALTAVQNAQSALSIASGPTAQAAAQAALLRAEKSYAQSISDIISSQISLAEAIATAQGDSIEAATQGLSLAQHKLDEANASGDQTKINEAQATVVAQQAAVRDAKLSEGERQIDVALQLEKITTQQAIAQFEALLQIPNLTKEETDNILLKIKQLQGQLSQDLQFDVPTGVKLPTIYEVRRLAAASGAYNTAGQVTNNNQQTTVTILVNNKGDLDQAVTTLVDAINGPQRNGEKVGPF